MENTFVENYIATIWVEFKEKIIEVEEATMRMQIWTTSGQERFKYITTKKKSINIYIIYYSQLHIIEDEILLL